MKLTQLLVVLTVAVCRVSSSQSDTQADVQNDERFLGKRSKKRGKRGGGRYRPPRYYDRGQDWKITVTNLAFNQPFSPFFVSVHNDWSIPLYQQGQRATGALALLAENGDPHPLVNFYTFQFPQGILTAKVGTAGATGPASSSTFLVRTTTKYPYISFASMAINTNDCFTGVAGIKPEDDMVLMLPGLDAGSEENNELCSSIPGPACVDIDGDNVRSGNGENFVHVHRGFFGIGPDLAADRYDWRNPMLRVVIEKI